MKGGIANRRAFTMRAVSPSLSQKRKHAISFRACSLPAPLLCFELYKSRSKLNPAQIPATPRASHETLYRHVVCPF